MDILNLPNLKVISVNRKGCGYSFEAIRARILFANTFQKIAPKFQKSRFRDGSFSNMLTSSFVESYSYNEPELIYGTPISTLDNVFSE